jgi:hypothetical protein
LRARLLGGWGIKPNISTKGVYARLLVARLNVDAFRDLDRCPLLRFSACLNSGITTGHLLLLLGDLLKGPLFATNLRHAVGEVSVAF